VLEVEPSLLLRRQVHLPTGIRDLEPAPGGGWWALCDGSPGRLVLLDSELREIWGRSSSACSAILCAAGEGVWLLDPEEGVVRRFDGRGSLEREKACPLLRGIEDAAILEGGALLLVGAGALLELDASGRARRSQGGFDHLAAIERARAR
jgi:hypothetical protein